MLKYSVERNDAQAQADIFSDAERLGLDRRPSATSGFMDSRSDGRHHRHADPNYRSLPRRPFIYPSRDMRRAPTLPVRFEDETIVQRGRTSLSPSPPRERRRDENLDRQDHPSVPEEDDDEIDIRLPRRRVSPSSPPFYYPEQISRVTGQQRKPLERIERRDRTPPDYYPGDDDEIDIRLRRGRESPAPTPYIDRRPRVRHGSHERHSRQDRRAHYQTAAGAPRAGAHRPRIYTRQSMPAAERLPSIIINNRVDNYYGEEEEEGDQLYQEAYTFTLSRHRKSLLSRDSAVDSLSDASENESVPISQTVGNIPQIGKMLHVLRAKYTGDASIGGDQSATLEFLQETGQKRQKSLQSVFKWVQFEDVSMNFDRFESGSENIVGPNENQKQAVSRLFSQVRRKFDKPMESPDGMKLRYMTPSILHEPISGNGKSKAGVVTWMCLPYFLLQKYSRNLSGLASSSHPTRTLLQSHFSFAEKGRDMQQAVCKISGTPAEHCFYIAQLWCLVIGDELIVTCSRTSISSLMGKSLCMSPKPSSPNHTGAGRNRPTNLLVCNENLLWSLPLDECQTWFAFLSHFWEYWPQRLQFLLSGKIIVPDTWAKVLDQASKSNIRISLEIKSNNKELKGILHSLPTGASRCEKSSEGLESAHQVRFNQKGPRDSHSKDISGQKVEKAADVTTRSSESTVESTGNSPKPHTSDKQYAVDDPNNNFHVFNWLNEIQNTTVTSSTQYLHPDHPKGEVNSNSSLIVDESNLQADLMEVDRFLRNETSFEERLVYANCPEHTRQEVYTMLKEEEEATVTMTRRDVDQIKSYEEKVELFNKADSLYQFFLSPERQGQTVEKYWGAIYRLLAALIYLDSGRERSDDIESRYSAPINVDEIIQWLSRTIRTVHCFCEVISGANSTERSNFELPEEMSQAWPHLLMAMMFSSNKEHISLFDTKSTICTKLLDEGTQKVVENLRRKSLLEYAVLKPLGLASLVNFVLLGDITGESRDISDTYVEYLSHLISGIENNPLDRGHQNKLTAFKQEIQVILKTLKQQQLILDYIKPVEPRYVPNLKADPRSPYHSTPSPWISRPQSSGSQIDPTDPGGIQGFLIQDSYALIDRKIDLFEELRTRAEELEDENNFKIEYNKDRQDSAIYAFTIVTIVFLPLSTVAGILGMNTSDLRNLNFSQWVFWATALPLTVIIIVLCLIWAGELENFWKGFSNLWLRKKRHGGGQI